MSIAANRLTLVARRGAGDQVVDALMPLKRDAHEAALNAARCLAAILEAHTEAGLPPAAGMPAMELAAEVSLLAVQSRAKVGALTEYLRAVAQTYHVTYAGPPNCPPNTMESSTSISA